jgi:copper chaperone CopZ
MRQLFTVITALLLTTSLPSAYAESDTAESVTPETHGDMAHDHTSHDHQSVGHDHESANSTAASITRTQEISDALEQGGNPVVVDVLGVVCDFCAVAMNKVFGKRDEVAAVYVDLDKKTLNLVVNKGAALTDKDIEQLAMKAGYRIAAIRRDSQAMGG